MSLLQLKPASSIDDLFSTYTGHHHHQPKDLSAMAECRPEIALGHRRDPTNAEEPGRTENEEATVLDPHAP